MSSGLRKFARASKIAGKKERRKTLMKVDFNQPILDVTGKQIEVTNLPRVMPVQGLDQLPEEDAKKYETRGPAAILKNEYREYLTFKTVAIESLRYETKADESISAVKKLERGRLAFRIYESNGEPCKVDVSEMDALKTLIARNPVYDPIVLVRCEDMIEGSSDTKEPTKPARGRSAGGNAKRKELETAKEESNATD